jgi:hypothetical protein
MPDKRIPLAEMIQALRAELQVATSVDDEEDEDAVAYRVNGIELELDVAVQRENDDEGQVTFYVIEANHDEDDTRETHTFRINLGPIEPTEE